MRRSLITLSGFVLFFCGWLQGCVPVVIGGVATTATAVHDRRTEATVLEDQVIELKAMAKKPDGRVQGDESNFSVTSYNLTLLLTGQAVRAETRDQFAEEVAKIDRVSGVINEIEVGPIATLSERARDSYLTGKVKAKLFGIEIEGFDPSRVKVTTEKGIVYLFGIVTDQEAQAVVEKARYTDGVKRVVKIFEYLEIEG